MPNKDDPPPPPPPPLDLNIIGVNLSANTEPLFSEGWMDLVQFSRVECWEGRRVDTNQRREKRNNSWGKVRVAYRDQENATRPTEHVWRNKKRAN